MKTVFAIFSLFLLLNMEKTAHEFHPQEPISKVRDRDQDILSYIFSGSPSPSDLPELAKPFKNAPPALTHTVKQLSLYQQSNQQALLVGVYSVDIMYAHTFQQHQQELQYWQATQLLMQKLQLDSYFGFDSLPICVSKNELNHIQNSISESLEKIYKTVPPTQDKRIWMLTGGLIESIYLLSHLNQESSSKPLREKIATYSYIINDLITAWENIQIHYPQLIDERALVLIVSLKKLYETYQQIKTQVVKPFKIYTDSTGNLAIDPEEIEITITDATLQSIHQQITEIRNQIIQPY